MVGLLEIQTGTRFHLKLAYHLQIELMLGTDRGKLCVVCMHVLQLKLPFHRFQRLQPKLKYFSFPGKIEATEANFACICLHKLYLPYSWLHPIKGTNHDIFLVRNTHESFAEAIQNTCTCKSKETTKPPQNCWNYEEMGGFGTFHSVSSVFYLLTS